ncbi:MAG: hypothetical protein IJW16_04025 [Clostridia bacterium]|nr:hypothetical protein [Clostridia bacterium]
MEAIKIEHGCVKMVAHRGAGKRWVENSLPAFRNAAQCSYWGIETDIHVTADGKYILIHDDETDRVTGEHYVVEKTDFETLRNLHLLGLEGDDARLPTLQEYIEICKSGNKYAVLELKNRMEEYNIAEIVEEINALGWLDRTVFISFSLTNMKRLEQLLPNHPKQFLYMKPERFALLADHPMSIDVDCRILTREMVDAIHSKGFEVNTWTVNTPEKAAEMIAMGVDYITTDILE